MSSEVAVDGGNGHEDRKGVVLSEKLLPDGIRVKLAPHHLTLSPIPKRTVEYIAYTVHMVKREYIENSVFA